MEVIVCLSVAILLVSARMSAEWSASAQAGVLPGVMPAKAVVGMVQLLSFACVGFAMGLISGVLILGFGGTRWNVGVPVLIAFTGPVVGVLGWGTFLAIRVWLERSQMPPECMSCNSTKEGGASVDSMALR